MNQDDLSLFVRKALNILFVANPKGTSIGVLIGVVLDGLIGLFGPTLKAFQAINISVIKMWHLVALGVVGINMPSYLRRKEIDPSIVNAMNYIEEQATKSQLPDWQVKQMYKDLYQKVLDNMSLDIESEKIAQNIGSLNTEPDAKDKSNKSFRQDK